MINQISRLRRRGQILPIFAMSAIMWLALLGLLIAGGFLITEKISLDSATEAAVLAGASQISISTYDNPSSPGAIQLETFIQPDADPCNTADTNNYNRLLCSIQTALCANYNNDNSSNDPNAVANCADNPNTTCPTPGVSFMQVSVCNVSDAGSSTCSVADYPSQVSEINYCVYTIDSGAVLTVVSWYTYPNPVGNLFASQLHATSTQLAQANVTQCTNGGNTCPPS